MGGPRRPGRPVDRGPGSGSTLTVPVWLWEPGGAGRNPIHVPAGVAACGLLMTWSSLLTHCRACLSLKPRWTSQPPAITPPSCHRPHLPQWEGGTGEGSGEAGSGVLVCVQSPVTTWGGGGSGGEPSDLQPGGLSRLGSPPRHWAPHPAVSYLMGWVEVGSGQVCPLGRGQGSVTPWTTQVESELWSGPGPLASPESPGTVETLSKVSPAI